MKPRLALALLGPLLATAIGACGNNPELRYAHAVDIAQPVAVAAMAQHDVRFAPGRTDPDPGEVTTLRAFLARHGVGYGDNVLVSVEGGATATAAGRRATLARLLRGWGYEPTVTAGTGPVSDIAVITIRRTGLGLPPRCSETPLPVLLTRPEDAPISRFGCATAAALGAMVADPGDLLVGRPSGMADGERAADMMRAYIERPHALDRGEDVGTGRVLLPLGETR